MLRFFHRNYGLNKSPSLRFWLNPAKFLAALVLIGLSLTLFGTAQAADPDGSVDPTFNSTAAYTNVQGGLSISDLKVQNDGKVLVSANRYVITTCFNGRCYYDTYREIFRLNPTGSLDVWLPSNLARSGITALQNDGKILVGGNFDSNGQYRAVTRLNSDISLDTSFTPPAMTDDITQIAVQNDGKILVAGATISGSTYRLYRLNANGSLDGSFQTNAVNGDIYKITVQADGKILVAGKFTINGAQNNLARLNADGSLDNSFSPRVVTGALTKIVVLRSGKILLGVTDVYDPTYFPSTGLVLIAAPSYLLRLNSDGTSDNSFYFSGTISSLDAASGVYAIAEQADGQVLVSGIFKINGVDLTTLVRLNPDGSVDPYFTAYDDNNSLKIAALAIQPDNKVLVGGSFSSIGGYNLRYIARLNNSLRPATTFTVSSSSNPSTYGENVTFTINATPLTATGSIFLKLANNANVTTVPLSLTNGVATYTTNQLGLGTTTAQVLFNGSAALLPGSSPLYNHSNRASTNVNLTSSSNSAQYGQNVTFTATVSSPSLALLPNNGLVFFHFPGVGTIPVDLVNGVATFITDTLPVGNYAVTAFYNGNENFYPSIPSAPVNQQITKAVSQVKINSSANPAVEGKSLSFRALVTPKSANASGNVTFKFNFANGSSASSEAVPVVNGIANYVTTTVETGSFTVTVNYSGDTNFTTALSPAYIQNRVTGCDPLLVTALADDGQATNCGTFSYALAQTVDGTITFNLPAGGNTLSFSGSPNLTLKPDVTLDGGANGTILNGQGVIGDGLRLSGNNTLRNLTIRGFSGRRLVLLGTGNHLFRVRIES